MAKWPDQIHAPDFADLVSLGFVDGFDDWRRWNENPDVSNTQEEMSNIGSGIRTLATSATVVTIASDSAEDGAGTLTGALSVHLNYLDENWLEQTEVVTLNGTGNVTTTGTAVRLQNAHVESVGSTGAAVGNITFTIDGNPQSRIKATQNETRETGIACPDDKLLILRSIEISTGRTATVDIDFAVEVRDNDTGVWYTTFSTEIYQNAVDYVDKHIMLGPRDDLRVLARGSNAGVSASVFLHGWAMEKDKLAKMGSNYAIFGRPKVVR